MAFATMIPDGYCALDMTTRLDFRVTRVPSSKGTPMSAWRREALKHLPLSKEIIEEAPSPLALWIELEIEFEAAYRKEPRDNAIIAGTYAFAIWCWHGPEHPTKHGPEYHGNNIDLVTAVFCAFFERLPKNPIIRRDMPNWLCLQDFEVLQTGPLAYFLNPDEHALMVSEFRQAKEKQSEHHLERCRKLVLRV